MTPNVDQMGEEESKFGIMFLNVFRSRMFSECSEVTLNDESNFFQKCACEATVYPTKLFFGGLFSALGATRDSGPADKGTLRAK